MKLRPEAYGDALHGVYDLMYPSEEAGTIVELIGSLVEPGARIVELGVGTGRVALPAARAGFDVTGIEASGKMIGKLRERDPEHLVKTVQGDFSEVVVDGNFELAYVVCNTLFMLPEVDDQIRALRKAAEHVVDGGHVLVEVYDPTDFHTLRKPAFQVRHLDPSRVMLETLNVDPGAQTMLAVHTLIEPGNVSTFAEVSRYAFPSELDLMARLAGLTPVDRWGDFRRGAFEPDSGRHVSLYRRAG